MEPNTNHNIYILHGQQGQVRVVSTSARTPSPIIFPAQVVSQPIFFPNSQHQRVQLRPTFTRDNFIQMNSSIPSTETTSVLCNNCGVPSNNCRICDSCKKKICTNPKIVKSNQEPERSNKTGISSSSFYSRNSRENDFASFLKKTSNLSLGKRTNPSKKRTCTGKLRNAGNDAECITISSSDEETSSSNTSTVQLSSPDPCEVPSKQAKHDKEEDCIEAARSSSSAPAPSDPQNSLPAFQLDVKGIRIGQMKLQSSSVEITNDKIMCLAHCHNSHKTIILSINWSWVMTCDLCNDPAVPCIYLTINPSFLDHLREMLGMNGDKPNYNPDGKADEKEFMVFIDTDQVTESKLAGLSERMKQIEKETGRNFIKLITKEQSESRQIVAAMTLSEDSNDASKTVTISQIQTKRMLTRNHAQQPAAANEATSSLHIDEDVPAFFSGVRKNLFVYPPPPATGGITVTNEDVFCLNEGEFLNDVIIDFYFKYITNVMISSVDSQRTHIMSSFFYKRLIQKSQKTDKDISLAKHRHNQVKKWTRNVDLFEKDFIFIPVNESSHWFLVVICFPSLVKTENKDFPKPLQHYGRDSDICGSSENEQNSSNVKKPHGSAGERRQFSAQCNHTTSRTLVLHSKVINKTDEDSDITSSPYASPEQRSSQSYFADVESSQDSIDQEDAGDSMIGTSINLFSSTSDEQPQKSSQKEPGKLFDVQCNYTTSKTLVSHKTINKTDEDPGVSSPHAPPEHCNVKTDGDEVLEVKIDKDQMLLATKENHELYKEEDPDSAFPGSNSQNFSQDDMIIIQDSTHLEAADAFQESSIAHSFSCNSGESSSQITEPNLQTSSQDDPPDSQTSQDSIDQEDAQNFSQEDSTHKPTSEDPNDQDDNATSLVDKDKTSGDSQEEFLSCNQSAASSSADKDSQNFPQEESNDEEVQKIIDKQETQDDVIEICVSPNNLTEFTLPSDLKDTWLISPHKKLRVSVSRMASQICDSRQKLETPNNTPEPLSSASNKDASFILISSGEEGEKRRNKKDEDPGTNSPGNGMKESLANEKIFKKPCILVFDSLKGHSRSRIACNLREYLSMEWKTRKAKQHGEREFNKDTIKMCTVPTPQQDNYSDCGIFLLHYVEKFFSNPIKNFTIPIKDLANWFDPAECKTKRNELKNLILGLEKKLKNEKD